MSTEIEEVPARGPSGPLRLWLDRLATPIGEMLVVTDGEGSLRAVDWTDHEARMHRLLRVRYGEGGSRIQGPGGPGEVLRGIEAYFAGELAAIDGLPVAAAGSDFQRTVWEALRRIPCGTTLSYGELARQIGQPAAVRAVGLANGANPVGVVVPCHRVIGADGSLTGYGGGLERKVWLLQHERGADAGAARQGSLF